MRSYITLFQEVFNQLKIQREDIIVGCDIVQYVWFTGLPFV